MPVNGPDQRSRNRRPRRRPAGRTPMGDYDEFQESDTRELDITELSEMNVNELQTIGRDLEMEADGSAKEELVDRILVRQSELAGHAYATGILDVVDEGFGFMRRHGLMRARKTSTSRPARSAASAFESATASAVPSAPRARVRSTGA